jgi:uncharacterized protein (DUF2267 family)
MSATGLEVFDKTLQSTNTWLKEIMGELGPDRQVAWHALGAVVHVLGRRLDAGQASNIRDALPEPIRVLWPAGASGSSRFEPAA